MGYGILCVIQQHSKSHLRDLLDLDSKKSIFSDFFAYLRLYLWYLLKYFDVQKPYLLPISHIIDGNMRSFKIMGYKAQNSSILEVRCPKKLQNFTFEAFLVKLCKKNWCKMLFYGEKLYPTTKSSFLNQKLLILVHLHFLKLKVETNFMERANFLDAIKISNWKFISMSQRS